MELRHQFVRCFRVTTLKLLPKIKVSLRSYWSLSDSLRKAVLSPQSYALPYSSLGTAQMALQGQFVRQFRVTRAKLLSKTTGLSRNLRFPATLHGEGYGKLPTKNLMALSGQSPGPRSEFSDEYPRARNPTSLVPLRHPKFLMTASVAKLLVRDQNLVISPHRPSQGYLRAPGMVWYRSHSILQPICHTVDSVCLAKGSKSAQKTKVFC